MQSIIIPSLYAKWSNATAYTITPHNPAHLWNHKLNIQKKHWETSETLSEASVSLIKWSRVEKPVGQFFFLFTHVNEHFMLTLFLLMTWSIGVLIQIKRRLLNYELLYASLLSPFGNGITARTSWNSKNFKLHHKTTSKWEPSLA